MEIDVRKDFENKMLNRREISLVVEFEGSTPRKEEVKEEVCKKLGLNPDSTAVVKINQMYGVKKSEVLVHAFKHKEEMVEPSYLSERKAKSKGAEAGESQKPEQEKKKYEPKKEEQGEEKEKQEKPEEQKGAEKKEEQGKRE